MISDLKIDILVAEFYRCVAPQAIVIMLHLHTVEGLLMIMSVVVTLFFYPLAMCDHTLSYQTCHPRIQNITLKNTLVKVNKEIVLPAITRSPRRT